VLTTSQSMLAAIWSPFCSRVVDALLLISIWRWEPEVLVLYRKREGAKRMPEHGVFKSRSRMHGASTWDSNPGPLPCQVTLIGFTKTYKTAGRC